MSGSLGKWFIALALACASIAWSGCGDDMAPAISGGPGDGDGDGDGDRDGGDGDGDGDAGRDAGGDGDASVDDRVPVVEIVSPDAMTDPNEDEVIIENEVTVRCRVTKGASDDAAEVDSATVKIGIVTESNDEGLTLQESVVTSVGSDEYEATLNIGDVDNGPLEVGCVGSDVREMPLVASGTRMLLVDHGPRLTIASPQLDSIHPAKNVTIDLNVEAWPLTDDDVEADIGSITLSVLGRDVELNEVPETAGRYTGTIKFGDKTLFPTAPATARIVATATNGRTPTPVTRTQLVDIIIDSEKPKIEVVAPADGVIVRGQVSLELMITDASTIDPASVIATITPGGYQITDWTQMDTKFVGRFDTTDTMFRDVAQLTINFAASDSAGNDGSARFYLRLDNKPPLISLDPPPVRDREPSTTTNICTIPYDPLGDAISDLGTSPESTLVRAFVYDETNRTPGDIIAYQAGVDPEGVAVYAQPDATIPLLIDVDGDDICDEINVDAEPEPTGIDLTGITPAGTQYAPAMADPAFVPFDDPVHTPGPGWGCVPGAGGAPMTRCGSTSMVRFTSSPTLAGDSAPAVFAFDHDAIACGGNAWSNLLSTVGEGWACIAGRAEDTIGNVGVSVPIRVCFDDGVGTPACDANAPETAPTCTDGCTSVAVPRNIVVNKD